MNEPSGRNLVLIGFMGVGKTRIGKLCAKRLNYTFQDSDKVIEERVGLPVAEFFAEHGEAAFRELERQVIAELAATPNLVIATGGGAVLNPENVANLRTAGFVVLLTATPEALLLRVGDRKKRPLLADAPDPRARIVALMAEREPLYERAAHFRLDTSHRYPQHVAEEIEMIFAMSE